MAAYYSIVGIILIAQGLVMLIFNRQLGGLLARFLVFNREVAEARRRPILPDPNSPKEDYFRAVIILGMMFIVLGVLAYFRIGFN